MYLLKHHEFAKYWLAGLLSSITGSMLFIALPVWVYREYNSAMLVSLIALVGLAPSVSQSSISGVLVDRWGFRRLAWVTACTRAALLFILVFVPHTNGLWLLLLTRFGSSLLDQFAVISEQSLFPTLPETELDLPQAIVLNQLKRGLGSIIGASLSGVLLGWIGLQGVAMVLTALTVAAAILLTRIRFTPTHRAGPSTQLLPSFHRTSLRRKFASQWRDANDLIVRMPVIRRLFLVVIMASTANIGYSALLVVFALDTLKASAFEVGLLFASSSAATMIGMLALGSLPYNVSAYRSFQAGILISSVLNLLFYGYPLVTGSMIALSLTIKSLDGFPSAVINVSGLMVFQTRIPPHLAGKVLVLLKSIQAMTLIAMIPVAGILADIFSAQAVMLSITIFLLASWILSTSSSDLQT